MLYRIFECTPEYFAADYNNPHLDDVFPINDTHWEKSSRQPGEYNVVSMTVYEIYHKVAMWPHIFTCLTIEPADSVQTKETDFFSRDLAQVALHRFKNKDVVLGSFIPDAVVLGIRGMMLHKRPTAIQSLHFKRGLRLDTVLDIFSNYANPDNSFEKVTKNCMLGDWEHALGHLVQIRDFSAHPLPIVVHRLCQP